MGSFYPFRLSFVALYFSNVISLINQLIKFLSTWFYTFFDLVKRKTRFLPFCPPQCSSRFPFNYYFSHTHSLARVCIITFQLIMSACHHRTFVNTLPLCMCSFIYKILLRLLANYSTKTCKSVKICTKVIFI